MIAFLYVRVYLQMSKLVTARQLYCCSFCPCLQCFAGLLCSPSSRLVVDLCTRVCKHQFLYNAAVSRLALVVLIYCDDACCVSVVLNSGPD